MATLHAFIASAAAVRPLEALEPKLTGIFRGQHSALPHVSWNTLLFKKAARLLYRWPTWSFSVTCESGDEVADAKYVAQELGIVFLLDSRPTLYASSLRTTKAANSRITSSGLPIGSKKRSRARCSTMKRASAFGD